MSTTPHHALEARVVRVARALGDRTRFSLLAAIAARGELSCQELTALFPVSQATVSHHLKALSDAGLITVERRGPFHHYRVDRAALEACGAELLQALGLRPARPARVPRAARQPSSPSPTSGRRRAARPSGGEPAGITAARKEHHP